MKQNKIGSAGWFEIFQYTVLFIAAIICVLPFIVILSGSFSSNEAIVRQGYGLLPRDFTLEAYQSIFRMPEGIIQAYKMTVCYTVMGTTVGVVIISLTAYVISRKEFKYRNNITFLLYFTTIFGGGLVPWYLMYANVLGLKGTTLVMWIPSVFSTFLVIVLRTFIAGSVPDEIVEAVKVDGAGHVTIFTRVVMPIIKPGLATVALFLSLGYWQAWFNSSMFSTSSDTWELQYYLYNMVNAAETMTQLAKTAAAVNITLPTQTLKLAMAVVVTGPILLFYPFMQRYFIGGITVGAIKG